MAAGCGRTSAATATSTSAVTCSGQGCRGRLVEGKTRWRPSPENVTVPCELLHRSTNVHDVLWPHRAATVASRFHPIELRDVAGPPELQKGLAVEIAWGFSRRLAIPRGVSCGGVFRLSFICRHALRLQATAGYRAFQPKAAKTSPTLPTLSTGRLGRLPGRNDVHQTDFRFRTYGC